MPDGRIARRKSQIRSEEDKIMESIFYARETSTLGGAIGSRAVSVGAQCDIKLVTKQVREMQRNNFVYLGQI